MKNKYGSFSYYLTSPIVDFSLDPDTGRIHIVYKALSHNPDLEAFEIVVEPKAALELRFLFQTLEKDWVDIIEQKAKQYAVQ